MPEGDTLARIASVLRPLLVGQAVKGARGRPGGAQLERVVGTTVESVEARGKHLLIGFENGLTLQTHLGLHGSWHRYRRGEPWRPAASRAVAVLETADRVAVCFDAPTVELLDTRALAVHPALRSLGTDVAADDFDVEAALAEITRRPAMAVGDALLDQRVVAGLGNVYRSELPFLERINPFTLVSKATHQALRGMLERGHRLVRANSGGGARVTTTAGTPGNLHVYGRGGRPCRACGTLIASRTTKSYDGANPRRVFWCPSCQPLASEAATHERDHRGGHDRAHSHGTTPHSRMR